MKIFDKLKNALFEEEYVEVEEKPKKKEMKKEHPVAKKIELPKREEKPVVEAPMPATPEEPTITDQELLNPEKDFHFPLEFDEEDFVEQPLILEQPKEEKPLPKKEPEPQPQEMVYHASDYMPKETRGLYEKKEEKRIFRPSPVISPVYGVLDKNYRKEEIVSKREVKRSSSSYSSNYMDLDAVRNKAYGDLSSDMGLAMSEEERIADEDQKIFEEMAKKEEDNLLVDMRDDDATPAVDKVTVGDAEEYFNDLGLQYNVDYKDASKERVTGRRVTLHQPQEEEPEEVEERKEEPIAIEDDAPVPDGLEDNLFDLIDSMYEDKEKE